MVLTGDPGEALLMPQWHAYYLGYARGGRARAGGAAQRIVAGAPPAQTIAGGLARATGPAY